MKTISQLLEFTFDQQKLRNWKNIYWKIDLHETTITGKYNLHNHGAEIYPYAKEVLTKLYNSKIHRTILWTSSHAHAANKALTDFDIKFHYFNENPECPSTELCDFSKKMYFNLVIEDKSGWEANKDWLEVKNTLDKLNWW